MKPHKWSVEEICGGHVGCDDFWVCLECGASGGWVRYNGTGTEPECYGDPPSDWIFYANGSGLDLPADCDESKRIIAEHLAAGGREAGRGTITWRCP